MNGDLGNATEAKANAMLGEPDNSGSPTSNNSGNVKRGRGRPPGSKNRPKDSAGNPIPTARVKASNTDEARFVYVPDENTERVAGNLLGNIWYILSPFIKARPLTDDEKLMLGKDAAPLIQKYIPQYDDFKYEIGFGLTIIGLYNIARRDWEKEHPKDDSDLIDNPTN